MAASLLAPRMGAHPFEAYLAGDSALAKSAIESVIVTFVGVVMSYVCVSLLWQTKEDLNAALIDYSKAIELNSHLAQAYANRAVILTLQGKKVEARQDFERAFLIDPSLRETFKSFIENRLNKKHL